MLNVELQEKEQIMAKGGFNDERRSGIGVN
jgi:hypothetical protein